MIKTKSLLQRAKPGLLEAIEMRKSAYPSLTADLERELSDNEYFNEIKYRYYVDLSNAWAKLTGERDANPWDWFDWD